MTINNLARPRRYPGVVYFAAGLTLLGAAPAFAAEALQPLQVVDAGDQQFVTGGVGGQERQRLFDRLQEYDLVVSFASHRGGFISNVDVTVARKGRHGSVTNFTTAGPYLLAKLPAGRYELTAALPGWTTMRQEITIDPAQRQRVYITLEPTHAEERPVVSQR